MIQRHLVIRRMHAAGMPMAESRFRADEYFV
jgi:hypothetical protein